MSDRIESSPRSEGVGPDFLLQITIGGFPYDRKNPNIDAGSVLDVSVSHESFEKYGGMYIVKTPLVKYLPDYETISRQDGGKTDLGVIPTLLFSGQQTVSIPTEADTLYDMFYLHDGQADVARVSTGKDPIPYRMTLDETKLWLGFLVGQTPDELRGVAAEIVGDKMYMRNRRQYFQYGFRVGKLGATIDTENNLGMFFVDHENVTRNVSPLEFGAHLRSVKDQK